MPVDLNHVDQFKNAKTQCKKDVAYLVQECKRTNQKYIDPYFNIKEDFKKGHLLYVHGLPQLKGDASLAAKQPTEKPGGVMRVSEIFDEPCFFNKQDVLGDIVRGRVNSCYFFLA